MRESAIWQIRPAGRSGDSERNRSLGRAVPGRCRAYAESVIIEWLGRTTPQEMWVILDAWVLGALLQILF